MWIEKIKNHTWTVNFNLKLNKLNNMPFRVKSIKNSLNQIENLDNTEIERYQVKNPVLNYFNLI
jgi:hypothetical protein